MSFQELIRKETPIGWCPGCGLYGTFYAACEVIDELGSENTVVISGIGCSGRGAGYFNLDSVHGIHGRAIPLAVGVKMSNPIVLSRSTALNIADIPKGAIDCTKTISAFFT